MSLLSELKPCAETKDSAKVSGTMTDSGNEISDKNSLQDFNELKRQVKISFCQLKLLQSCVIHSCVIALFVEDGWLEEDLELLQNDRDGGTFGEPCATALKRQIPSSGITKNDSWWKEKKAGVYQEARRD